MKKVSQIIYAIRFLSGLTGYPSVSLAAGATPGATVGGASDPLAAYSASQSLGGIPAMQAAHPSE